ncbi:Integrating conjugative element protein, family [Pseudomonas savastanoi pv. glycinea]|uniref:TIGR03757 family integrating conjugative element protein n=1 Tax=Pseudomonas quasicaspiana TaxID=2829821 RepID=UPI000EFF2E95|nr:TIGR03757 family integrating conjugative element protein [Pseudomonas quasicaspiana]MCD5976782.1 TIGR03757 family integrating conjugative element protein [Pseudomonas quasicaspiana]RMQ98665.1 Integrating conjugative element protein, family [Pseudomonas savastanoi pv. glycinea]
MSPRRQALTACLITLLASSGANGEILLITTNQSPLAATKNIRTINLDLPAMLEADLSSALPANPAEAQAIATQRITPDLAAQLTQAHQNVTDAWSMGVTKVPAVVVDRKYVVYGETNVQRALHRINEYRRQEP